MAPQEVKGTLGRGVQLIRELEATHTASRNAEMEHRQKVLTTQPTAPSDQPPELEWTSEMFTCCNDLDRLQEMVVDDLGRQAFNRRGRCFKFPGVWCFTICMQRVQQRNKFGIGGSLCRDCLAACCCTPCTLLQMSRQIQKD